MRLFAAALTLSATLGSAFPSGLSIKNQEYKRLFTQTNSVCFLSNTIISSNLISGANNQLMARQQRSAYNWLPTPLVEGTSYRLLGGVVFTVTNTAAGIIEMVVQDFLANKVDVSLSYTFGELFQTGVTLTGMNAAEQLTLYPPQDFTGTFEIKATIVY
jgi:hypothetical protein